MAIMVAAVLVIAVIFSGIMIYGRYQMGKIPELSFKEALEYTTKDNSDAVLTVVSMVLQKKWFLAKQAI